ncbi:MAG TPA: ABC transporter substrate-binding protein [Candidatus Tectomicrobia bacterium]|nr:ABC transporter substrate-binding protein [Candidatus Tectomicrobia bacterium]
MTDRIAVARRAWPLLALLLLVVSTLVLEACSRRDEAEKAHEQPAQATQAPASGGTYRRPLGYEPASLDPAKLTDSSGMAVANQIFDSLVEFDAHLNVLPALAQSWSASRDGLTWTFNLRQGVKFHNGREMVADDVMYSLSRLLDPAVRSKFPGALFKVEGASAFQAGRADKLQGVRVIDRFTVQITLSEPFAPFVSVLGLPHLAVIPREDVERLGAEFDLSPVGTGPFRFVRWEKGHEIVLDANEHYFRTRPVLDHIRFVIFGGNRWEDMLAAFERQELEESPIPPNRRKELLETDKYKVIQKPTLSLLLVGFNSEIPPFDKREIRQAFNYAIDKVSFNREIRGDRFVLAKGILPPGMPGYNPEVQAYSYDPDKAKKLLAEAGFPGGKNLDPAIWASSSKTPVARQDYQLVKQTMAQLGIQLELNEFDNWPVFQQALEQGTQQMFRYAWSADYPDPDSFLYPMFHSRSVTNYFRYRNPMVDRLLDEARRETDDLRRVKLYREAEQAILNDAPAVMILHFTTEKLFQPYVKGIELSALGESYIPMWKISLNSVGQATTSK